MYNIEIKKSASPKNAAKHFSVLNALERETSEEDVFSGADSLKTAVGEGAVICMAPDVVPIDTKNRYVPAWII